MEDEIIEAIGLLKVLGKELRKYAMMVRESYGKHFPELARIVRDNILYAKAAKFMGRRSTNAANLDFSEILPVEVETELKEAAMTSMGTEVSDLDLMNINNLCDQVLSLSENRAQHYDDLKSRMNTIAPNLTALVGEVVGARLIARGGGLLNLAKQPASTVQILGAKKALKTEQATPKCGLINRSSLIGQAAPKHKGKIARSLAAKISLAIRCDAFGDKQDNSTGLANRLKLQTRLRNLEGKPWNKDHKKGSCALITRAKTYNPSADFILGRIEAEAKKDEEMVPQGELAVDENQDKKKKKEKKEKNDTAAADAEDTGGVTEKKKRKHVSEVEAREKRKKKRKHAEPEEEKKDKKKKKEKKDTAAADADDTGGGGGVTEKKKKKHVSEVEVGEKRKKKRKQAEPEEEKKDKKKKKERKEKKEKRDKKKKTEKKDTAAADAEDTGGVTEKKKKKHVSEVEVGEKRKKKRKHAEPEEEKKDKKEKKDTASFTKH